MARILATILILFALPAAAEYAVVGPITGEVCEGRIFKSCSNYEVVAVSDEARTSVDKPLRQFRYVDFHKARVGLCMLNTATLGDRLYTLDASKKLKEIRPEYVIFKCVKRPKPKKG